jgi:hypothetical protein
LDAEQSSNTDLLDLTSLEDYDSTNPVLLNDAHSFLEFHNNESNTINSFDSTAQFADSDMQDQFLWGSLGMDFMTSSGFS